MKLPEFVPYFAVVVFVLFGIGFYFALLNFRKASVQDREDADNQLAQEVAKRVAEELAKAKRSGPNA